MNAAIYIASVRVAFARHYADSFLSRYWFGYQDADGELWLTAFQKALAPCAS